MKNWYNTLAPRERLLVFYGSILSALILFWILVVNPLYENHKKLNKVIGIQKTAWDKMQKQGIEVKSLQQQESKPKNTSTGNPQQLVERSLQTWRLKPQLERMQSQGASGVTLSLKNANADRSMRFLYEIENKYGLTISNLIINNTNSDKKDTGFINIRLSIKR